MTTPPTEAARKRRGRPRLATTEARRDQILDAAVPLVAEAGDRSVTIDEIAKAAGLVRAQIYEVFPSKDALIDAAVERESRRINDYMLVIGKRAFELPLPERIRALYRSIFDYRDAFPHSLQLFRNQELSHPGTGTSQWRDLIAQRMRREFEAAGIPSRQLPDVLSTMLMGLVEATANRSFEEPGWDTEAVVEVLAAFSLGGFDGLTAVPEVLADVDAPRDDGPTPAQERSGDT
jgi:AcrR family transcriptional regulator